MRKTLQSKNRLAGMMFFSIQTITGSGKTGKAPLLEYEKDRLNKEAAYNAWLIPPGFVFLREKRPFVPDLSNFHKSCDNYPESQSWLFH